jgi:hypothetical protein
MNKYLSPATFTQPRIITSTSAFGHVPFFFWLISILKPRSIVELGTMYGYSFFAFCQAAEALQPPADCYAVDTWEGDLNTGKYGEQVYANVQNYLSENFNLEHAHLLRMRFDEAAEKFAPGSVDLIFIDGCHTYEAVKEDFLTWKDKMSDRGVMMFHDTRVEAEGFGVKQFWNEVRVGKPHIEFHHDHGLGILFMGSEVPGILLDLAREPEPVSAGIRNAYATIGEKYQHQWDIRVLNRKLQQRDYEIELLRGSLSWKLTSPLRLIHSLIGGGR